MGADKRSTSIHYGSYKLTLFVSMYLPPTQVRFSTYDSNDT